MIIVIVLVVIIIMLAIILTHNTTHKNTTTGEGSQFLSSHVARVLPYTFAHIYTYIYI